MVTSVAPPARLPFKRRLEGYAVNADRYLRTVSGIAVLRNYGIGSGIPGQVNVRGVPGLHGLLMLSDGYLHALI